MTKPLESLRERRFTLPLTGVFFFIFFFSFSTIKPLSNVLLLVLVVIWIKGWLDQETRRRYLEVIRRSSTVWLLIALSMVIVVHIWGSPGEAEWIERHLRKYARFLYAAILILLLFKKPVLQRYALWGFISAMVFTLISTWLNLWFLLPWSVTQETGWGASHHVFGDYITQNLMMALFVAITLSKLAESESPRLKFFWGSMMGLAIVSITHLSLGRTGLVALLVAVLASLFVLLPRKWSLGGGVLVLVVGALSVASSDLMISRWIQAYSELLSWQENRLSSIGHRLYNYETTVALILERPWFGHGTGAFHTEICRHINPISDCYRFNWHPHNQFLLLASDHGLLGLLLYLALIVSLFLTAVHASQREARTLLSALSSILFVNSLMNSPIWSSIESQFFLFMMGLFVSMALTPSSPNPKSTVT